MATQTWLDRAIGYLSPAAGLRRLRARAASGVMLRHYEAAAVGRRTQGWKRSSADANTAVGAASTKVRDVARDLVRNNGYAESALTTIIDHVVGTGIVAKPKPKNEAAGKTWSGWANSTDCDADGRNDFAGLQALVCRTVIEAGEVLVRQRIRRPEDGFAIPMQLQVLDPDYLDSDRNAQRGPNRVINGVEFDAIGRRVAYWLFPEHPGATGAILGLHGVSTRVPAEGVLHIYRQDRPGQVRGISWFAPVLVKFKDFDEYEDATIMKQKIAACLAVVSSDPDSPLGTTTADAPTVDSLEPGMILRGGAGQFEVVQPPSVREYPDYVRTTLRAIATGLGVSYEDLTGDYTSTNFSSARMSRLRHWARVEAWRWRMLIPQFCDPVWAWVMEAAAVMNAATAEAAKWTAPAMPMIDPSQEGLAYQRLVRSGLMTQSEAIRERGYDPDELYAEMAEDNAKLDRLGLTLDSDPRRTTQAGNPTPSVQAETAPARPDDPEEDDADEAA